MQNGNTEIMASILQQLRTYQKRSRFFEDGSIERLTPGRSLETGMITLYGSTGIAYPTKALNIPGHGWVPCSSRLSSNFTNDSSRLIIVHSTKYVTSNIWVTLAN